MPCGDGMIAKTDKFVRIDVPAQFIPDVPCRQIFRLKEMLSGFPDEVHHSPVDFWMVGASAGSQPEITLTA